MCSLNISRRNNLQASNRFHTNSDGVCLCVCYLGLKSVSTLASMCCIWYDDALALCVSCYFYLLSIYKQWPPIGANSVLFSPLGLGLPWRPEVQRDHNTLWLKKACKPRKHLGSFDMTPAQHCGKSSRTLKKLPQLVTREVFASWREGHVISLVCVFFLQVGRIALKKN